MNHDLILRLEQAVVGSVLVDATVLDLVYPLGWEHFQDPKARAVWNAFVELRRGQKPIDVVTVESALADLTGSPTGWVVKYLADCAFFVPSPKHAVEYAVQIREASLTRRVMSTLAEVLEEAKRGTLEGPELLSTAMAGLAILDAELPDEAQSIGELVKQRVKQLESIAEEWASGRKTMTGFPTGISSLDEHTGGWQPGIMSIVAARPGMGKSSLGLATADACSKAGHGVHVFSLEDTREAYSDRSISRTADVPAQSLRSCKLNQGEMERTRRSVNDLHKRKGWLVDDRSGLTADEIVRSVRRRARDNGTKVVIVDYIQRCKTSRNPNRHEALGEMALAFSDAAKQDRIAYVVMSQLNRGVEQRADKRPQLSDLRESGTLEELAKCVVGVYRGAYYGDAVDGVDYKGHFNKPSPDEWERRVELGILKNSNGATGDIVAQWNGPTTRIW